MKDREPTPGKEGRVKIVTDDGTVISGILTMDDDPLDLGTPLNKSTLLKDDTAALSGLGADAVPDDVLRVLGRFNSGLGREYLWAKTQTKQINHYNDTRYTAYDYNSILFSRDTNIWPKNIKYSNQFTVNADNKFELVGGGTLSVTQNNYSDMPIYNVLKGKYVESPSHYGKGVTIFKYDSNATFTLSGNYVYGVPCNRYTNPSVTLETVVLDYLNSPNEDAYPPSVPDGYEYVFMGQLGDKARIVTGSYVGTGKYGKSNPNKLDFPFKPKFLAVTNNTTQSVSNFFFWWPGVVDSHTYMAGSDRIYFTQSGNSLSWWNETNASKQYNSDTFNYIAIG